MNELSNPPLVLKIEGLSKKYGSHQAVNGLNLELRKGQIYGLLGPNGSGKTTTLGMLLGTLAPDSGQIAWFPNQSVSTPRKKVGALLEQPNFVPWLSCSDNLMNVLGIRSPGLSSSQKKQEVDRCLGLTGIAKARDEKFSSLSLGMKQRLAIAACIVADPEILVLDEPTNGIDAQGIVDIRNLILEQANQGKTVLLASHMLDEVEKVCSHVIILQHGKTLHNGPISSLQQNSQNVLAQFHTTLTPKDIENIKELEIVIDCAIHPIGYCVALSEGAAASSLNKELFRLGLVASHLEVQKSDLEAEFLSLLDQS